MRLQGKTAMVTGAGRGIGAAIADALAAEGAALAVCDLDGTAAAKTAAVLAERHGARAVGVGVDIADSAAVRAAVSRVRSELGPPDILVNNAGIEFKRPFVDFPLDLWQKIMAVDLTGPFLCAQAAARQMIQQGTEGRIINISSVHEDLPMPTNAPYCAAKGGLRMLMRTIAVELAPHKITVNNIGPGAIFTPIDKDVEADEKLNSQLMAEIPLGRWGRPEEVAQLAVYLASDAAAYVTGSTHFIDGGMLRQSGSL